MNRIQPKRWLASAWPRTSRKNSILVFHSTGSSAPASLNHDRFRYLIDLIAGTAQFVPLQEVLHDGGGDAMRVAITFDDGYRDNFTHAYPVLLEKKIPFTVFVTTSFVDGNADLFHWSPHYAGLPALSWAELQFMSQTGVAIGSHTVTHPRLANCPTPKLRAELRNSKLRIEEKLGVLVDTIAYPFGQDHDISEEVLDATETAGYQFAFTTLPDLVPREIRPMAIPRITIDNDDDEVSLMQKLDGRRRFMVGISKVRSTAVRLKLLEPLIPDRQLTGPEQSAPSGRMF